MYTPFIMLPPAENTNVGLVVLGAVAGVITIGYYLLHSIAYRRSRKLSLTLLSLHAASTYLLPRDPIVLPPQPPPQQQAGGQQGGGKQVQPTPAQIQANQANQARNAAKRYCVI